MKKTIVVAALVCLAVSSTLIAQSKVTEVFRTTLRLQGLGHLAPDDMAKVEDLLVGLNRAHDKIAREKVEAYDSVVEYLEGEGFTPELVMMGRRGDKDLLIVGRTLRYATTDVPLTLGVTLPSGTYFVRRGSSLGGFQEIIAKGRIHRFFLANWTPFP
jgi:hypothetical protein